MKITHQIANHFHDVFFGGNWTSSNFSELTKDISWEEAISRDSGTNNIATLTFHIGYYLHVISDVLHDKPITSKDELSFLPPTISSDKDWNKLRSETLSLAKSCSRLISDLNDSIWNENFSDPKYGTYYRNISGIIEHTHYHLGQIALIKKIIRNKNQ